MGADAAAAANATSTQATGPHKADAEKSKSNASEAGLEQASNGAKASAVAAAAAGAATMVSQVLANNATTSTGGNGPARSCPQAEQAVHVGVQDCHHGGATDEVSALRAARRRRDCGRCRRMY
jgi:hypothetical protein